MTKEMVIDEVKKLDAAHLLQIELLARTLRLNKSRRRETAPIPDKPSVTDSLAGSLAGFTGSLEDIRNERLALE
ncbi:hypothetical protein AGMMS49944_12050 [Spirochaetia bacterium]|nr:hypothetical protein AGMMS49944_12050 [Spirochaetia bacterium]